MPKIDYVVPMVFAQDPQWQAEYRKAKGIAFNEHTCGDAVRYRSWNNEQLLCQCVRKFMPFVRNIIILLASNSQKKLWMQQEGIRVVLHSEFMPANKLPTFNSRAMEMYFHRIPGLSERFLYGNDDMFPLSPLQEDEFFIGATPCQHHTTKPFPLPPNQFQAACMGGLNFVAKEFGMQFKNTWLRGGHSIAPILLDTCRHLWQRDPQAIDNSVTPFRTARNFNQYIYSWYQHLSGNYIDRVPPRKYLSVKSGIDKWKEFFSQPVKGIVCFNDNECVDNIQPFVEVVRENVIKLLSQ